jgi:hypothetical protein
MAPSLPDALMLTHALGINPGGDVKIHELPQEAVDEHVLPADRYRLLSREEIQRVP